MEFQGVVGEAERGFRERDAEQNRLDNLRDDYYVKHFFPQEAYLTGVTRGLQQELTVANFTNGVVENMRWTFPKPAYWRNGLLKVDYWWGTDGTSATAMNLAVEAYGYTNDSLLSTKTQLMNEASTLTPSGSALYNSQQTETGSVAITDDMKIVSLVLERDGVTDANTDAFLAYCVRVTFLPNRRQ